MPKQYIVAYEVKNVNTAPDIIMFNHYTNIIVSKNDNAGNV